MSVISSRSVKIRKKHKCVGCARTMPERTKMEVVKYSDGRKISTSYWCETCQAYWDKYMNGDDEISVGDLKAEDPEGWETVRKTIEQ